MLSLRRKMRFLAPWGVAFALFTACDNGNGGGGEEGEPGVEGETVPPEPEES